jgi:hypothetical protein
MIAGQGQSFASLLQGNYAERFGAQSEILKNINQTLSPIMQAGPDTQGFGAQELAALKTAATEGVGRNYAKATAALNNQLAVRGGGAGDVTSGAEGQLKEELASSAAQKQSDADLAITAGNYAQGRRNWQEATAGLSALAREYDPSAFSGQAIDANKNAFGEATQVQNMRNQKEAEIAGGIASLAMGAATFGMGGMAGLEGTGGEGFWGKTGDFLKGGVDALGSKG